MLEGRWIANANVELSCFADRRTPARCESVRLRLLLTESDAVTCATSSVAVLRVTLSRSSVALDTMHKERRCCSMPVRTIDVRGSGRTAADSDGTTVPIGSVMLSRVTLSRNSFPE